MADIVHSLRRAAVIVRLLLPVRSGPTWGRLTLALDQQARRAPVLECRSRSEARCRLLPPALVMASGLSRRLRAVKLRGEPSSAPASRGSTGNYWNRTAPSSTPSHSSSPYSGSYGRGSYSGGSSPSGSSRPQLDMRQPIARSPYGGYSRGSYGGYGGNHGAPSYGGSRSAPPSYGGSHGAPSYGGGGHSSAPSGGGHSSGGGGGHSSGGGGGGHSSGGGHSGGHR